MWDVLFPTSLLGELGLVTVRRLQEDRGVVVEVEAKFMSDDYRRIGRYLQQRKGPPAESEEYDRQTRGGGMRRSMADSWYSAASDLHFFDISESDRSNLRGYDKRWANEERARQKKEISLAFGFSFRLLSVLACVEGALSASSLAIACSQWNWRSTRLSPEHG